MIKQHNEEKNKWQRKCERGRGNRGGNRRINIDVNTHEKEKKTKDIGQLSSGFEERTGLIVAS